MYADAMEVRKNSAFFHPGMASFSTEIQIGEAVVGRHMCPVQFAIHTDACLIEMAHRTVNDLFPNICHDSVQPFGKTADHAADGTCRQRYPKHAAENLSANPENLADNLENMMRDPQQPSNL